MADKPILFSGPMARAQLEGRKTQTRRGLVLRRYPGFTEFGPSDTKGYDWHLRDREKRWHDLRHAELLKLLPYQIGDRLWVRERWNTWGIFDDLPPSKLTGNEGIAYAADMADPKAEACGRLRAGMHMPRWASRLTNIVADVRIQRLQDISEADAIAEGVERLHHGFYPYGISTFVTTFLDGKEVPAQCCSSARDSYHMLWDSIHGPGSWDANPWVAAFTFTVHRSNIDAMGVAA